MENEYRLCVSKIELDSLDEGIKASLKFKINHDFTDSKISEYIEIDLEALCSYYNIHFNELIDEIIIGPKSIQYEEVIKRYLRATELECLSEKLKKSRSSLR